jgi:septum formation topological specificity factor MinE
VEPYTKIVGELPEMRRDAVELVKKAVEKGRGHMFLSIIGQTITELLKANTVAKKRENQRVSCRRET